MDSGRQPNCITGPTASFEHWALAPRTERRLSSPGKWLPIVALQWLHVGSATWGLPGLAARLTVEALFIVRCNIYKVLYVQAEYCDYFWPPSLIVWQDWPYGVCSGHSNWLREVCVYRRHMPRSLSVHIICCIDKALPMPEPYDLYEIETLTPDLPGRLRFSRNRIIIDSEIHGSLAIFFFASFYSFLDSRSHFYDKEWEFEFLQFEFWVTSQDV